jgi:hypothetical protein
MTFFSDVSPSLNADDLTIVNVDTGQAIDPAAMAVTFETGTNNATFTFPGLPDERLPEGHYRATLLADAVTDPGGTPLAQDEVFDFYYMLGDANQDGRVNLRDFNILAANFGLAGRDFTQGDFNYDGLVDMEDFNLLAVRFGAELPPATLVASVFGTPASAATRIIDQLDELADRDPTGSARSKTLSENTLH